MPYSILKKFKLSEKYLVTLDKIKNPRPQVKNNTNY